MRPLTSRFAFGIAHAGAAWLASRRSAEYDVYVEHEKLASTILAADTVWIDHRQITQTKLRGMLEPWLDAADDKPYHAMISYRWGKADSALADALYDILSARELHSRALYIFQDHRRLTTGDNFKHSFMRAMSRAMVVLPIVSWDALKRMTTLTAQSVRCRR